MQEIECASPFERHVVRALEALKTDMDSRLTSIESRMAKVEEQGRDVADALLKQAHADVDMRRELNGRIDDLREETQSLAQAAMGARLDAEKAERVAAHAVAQRDDAVRALQQAPDFHHNGNGHAPSAPPEPI